MIPAEDRVYKVFIDFDGTITTKDVGEEMFLKFGDAQKSHEIIELWMNGKISSIQTWEMLCQTVVNLDRNDFDQFIDSIEIDSNFLEFVTFCKENNIDIKVVSDGLDYYINRILKNYNLEHLHVFSNKMEFIDGTIKPSFPFTDEECKECANCKRNHVINYSSDDDFTIYIGDGYSDKCPAQFCDFIFAKNSLLKYCEKNRITYFPYRNFYEVKRRIEDILKKKRLKKKVRAELKEKQFTCKGRN